MLDLCLSWKTLIPSAPSSVNIPCPFWLPSTKFTVHSPFLRPVLVMESQHGSPVFQKKFSTYHRILMVGMKNDSEFEVCQLVFFFFAPFSFVVKLTT